jgi:aldehyde reductase
MLYQQANPGEMEQVVKEAIDAGYRHFDTALFYKNEKEVGAAIRTKIAEGVIRREDVFVTTKVRLQE